MPERPAGLRARLARLEAGPGERETLVREMAVAPGLAWACGERLDEAARYPRAWAAHVEGWRALLRRPAEET